MKMINDKASAKIFIPVYHMNFYQFHWHFSNLFLSPWLNKFRGAKHKLFHYAFLYYVSVGKTSFYMRPFMLRNAKRWEGG